MSAAGCTIRLARVDELGALLAIDEAASTLYESVGLRIELAPDHPFVRAEAERWSRAIDGARAFVAVDDHEQPVGFACLEYVDGAPYLDQLAVRPAAMRRGIGRALVARAIAWAGDAPLVLTTYDHVPWNRPYYARLGFTPLAAERCGEVLRRILASQRAALPAPEMRVALVRPPGPLGWVCGMTSIPA